MNKSIKFEIKDGKLVYDAQGFQGSGCAESTKFLRDLGDGTMEKKLEFGAARTERGLHELN